ncbi:MAG: ABC transporter ATP-binding protein [Deltaproteobacteria bacterium]|nr:ABC transporter ATP-binding protein [Deltaproteobacteria bacterium]
MMTTLLQINSVDKNFSGLQVLLGINLTVEHGERHAIIGPNGAGKSTLFNVITGKHRVSDGQILFKDLDITNWPPHRVCRVGLARSFQVTNIFPNMTVYNNIRNVIVSKKRMRFNMVRRLGNIEDVAAETQSVLETIGLESASETPAGELAYGHQRALEIGLALAMDPELVLLDEPTAGMTTEETRDAVKLIERITAGKTLVIIEHDMDVVFSISDRISVLYYGKILATGTAEEIKESQEVKNAYLGSKK